MFVGNAYMRPGSVTAAPTTLLLRSFNFMSKKPVMLCIMDGFGWTPDKTFGNAVAAANKPNLD